MSDWRETVEEETEDADGDQIQQQQSKKKRRRKKEEEKEKENRDGFERRLRVTKNLIMLPLRKLEKVYARRKRKPPPPPFPYSEDLGQGCHHLCFMHPRIPSDSPPLRPDSGGKSSSYHGFLWSLLERNDFYSPECNVHRD